MWRRDFLSDNDYYLTNKLKQQVPRRVVSIKHLLILSITPSPPSTYLTLLSHHPPTSQYNPSPAFVYLPSPFFPSIQSLLSPIHNLLLPSRSLMLGSIFERENWFVSRVFSFIHFHLSFTFPSGLEANPFRLYAFGVGYNPREPRLEPPLFQSH